MATVPPAYQKMAAGGYTDTINTECVGGAYRTTHFTEARLPFSKELIHDDLSLPMPTRRARQNRIALAGWIAFGLLGCLLFWSFLSPLLHTSFSTVRCPTNQTGYQNLFILGDSYSTTLFDVFGAQPNDVRPLGNSHNLKPVWVDYLTSTYNSTKTHTYNLAVGGSPVDKSIVIPEFAGSSSFAEQVRDVFVPHYGAGSQEQSAAFSSDDTLFAIWFGINDIVISAGKSQHTPLDRIFESYESSMEVLYQNGARHFLLMNVPPVDSVYRVYDTKTMRFDIDSFNSRLLSFRMHFQRAHMDSSTWVFDVHELYTQVMRNPQIYEETANLKNTTEICGEYLLDQSPKDVFSADCGVPLSQYFWQSLHTTAAVHKVTAALVAQDCLGPKATSPSGYCS